MKLKLIGIILIIMLLPFNVFSDNHTTGNEEVNTETNTQTEESLCGNGRYDPGEECDIQSGVPVNQQSVLTCNILGIGNENIPKKELCSSECKIDTSTCPLPPPPPEENENNGNKNRDVCKDLDGGSGEESKFTESFIEVNGNQIYDDCSRDSKSVIEMSCLSDGGYKDEIMNCEFGCMNGACLRVPLEDPNQEPEVKEPEIICEDVGDNGREEFIRGGIQFGEIKKVDRCDGDVLVEFFCNSEDQFLNERIECENGCNLGKCNDFSTDDFGEDIDPTLSEDEKTKIKKKIIRNKIVTDVKEKREKNLELFENNPEILVEEDGLSTGKIFYDKNEEEVSFIDPQGEIREISIDKIKPKKIKKIINGVDTVEEVEPVDIALISHKIENFRDEVRAEEVLENIEETMTKVEVSKEIEYDPQEDRTTFKLDLEKKTDEGLSDFAVYLIIPKETAETVADIDILNDGNGQRFVVEEDPIIGWYFEEGEEVGDISYEVDGEAEDAGFIVMAEKAVLFNGPDIVVNYREEGCNPGEILLFELDSLENSRVYEPNSERLYKVCFGHVSFDYGTEEIIRDTEILDYNDEGRVSLNDLFEDKQVEIGIPDRYEWDLRIAEQRPGDSYSCLGSVENKEDSLYGDCLYEEEKIWVKLEYIPLTAAEIEKEKELLIKAQALDKSIMERILENKAILAVVGVVLVIGLVYFFFSR